MHCAQCLAIRWPKHAHTCNHADVPGLCDTIQVDDNIFNLSNAIPNYWNRWLGGEHIPVRSEDEHVQL